MNNNVANQKICGNKFEYIIMNEWLIKKTDNIIDRVQ